MTLYEMIDKRRSVRQYSNDQVSEATVNGIRQFVANAERLSGQNARFEIVSSKELNTPVGSHAILAYCDEGDIPYANVGYVLQKADLYIQSLGLGSLWLGMGKPREKKDKFCIMLAFGSTELPQRKSEAEFNRLPITKISNEDNAAARAVRLAPSAQNSQPWELHFYESKMVISYTGRGLFRQILKKKLNKIDIGIATRHAELALQNEGVGIKSIIATSDTKNLKIEIQYANV
jgi:nitroreductase